MDTMTTLSDPLNLNSQRRRRWTDAAELIATKIVPPVVMFGGTLLQFNTSTGIKALVLLFALLWLANGSTKENKQKATVESLDSKLEEIDVETEIADKEEAEDDDDKSTAEGPATGAKLVPDLFPSISDVIIDNEEGVTAKSCSTGLTTRLLPFKNKNGEIEWAFTDDMSLPGSELDVFKIKSEAMNMEKSGKTNVLTPTTSNSSNSDSISDLGQYRSTQKLEDTPLTNNSFSDADDDEKTKSSSGGEQEGVAYQCPHCDVSFKIRGYLTRHLKKHAVKKAYLCPFYNFSIYVDENNLTHKCHPNGGFSRRDTYKTHLKSRHFKYPKGIKTKERTNSPGYCGMCNEYFPNSEIWCEIHIEGGECRHLPTGFKGKSRIKNKLRKEQRQRMKESGKQQQIAESNMLRTHLTSPSKTPSNYDTPQSYSYYPQVNSGLVSNNGTNSPALSSNSDMAVNYVNTPNSLPATTYQISPPSNKTGVDVSNDQMNMQYQYVNQLQHHQPQPVQPQPVMQAQPLMQPFLQFDHVQPVADHGAAEEYDDEYCLDLDQLFVCNNTNFSIKPANNVIGGEVYL